jgi:methionyl-tRNA formyltransferase
VWEEPIHLPGNNPYQDYSCDLDEVVMLQSCNRFYMEHHILMSARNTLSTSSVGIVIFGSEGGFSRLILEQLLGRRLTILAVVMMDTTPGSDNFPIGVTQPVKPGGLAELATQKGVDVIRTQTLADKVFVKRLEAKHADLLLVACFKQKIPARIWQEMKIPCWNLHPSLLPGYRGPSPLYWQIKNGESKTGLTLHEVTSQIDAGDIVARKSVAFPAYADNNAFDNWVSTHGAKLLHKTLKRFLLGNLNPESQDETIASYFPAPDSEDRASC